MRPQVIASSQYQTESQLRRLSLSIQSQNKQQSAFLAVSDDPIQSSRKRRQSQQQQAYAKLVNPFTMRRKTTDQFNSQINDKLIKLVEPSPIKLRDSKATSIDLQKCTGAEEKKDDFDGDTGDFIVGRENQQ